MFLPSKGDNNQNEKGTMSIDKWMDKEDVVLIDTGILHSHKNE